MPFASIDASADVEIFTKNITPKLNIASRYAGSEPYCAVTRQYNRDMRNILPKYGISFVELPRLDYSSLPISASKVRELVGEKKFDEVKNYVPESTLNYLRKLNKDKDTYI